MAKKNTSKSKKVDKNSSKAETPTTRDNVRWIGAFVLIAVGIFLLCAIVSSFFYWKEDMSALAQIENNIPGEKPKFGNMCSQMGASIAASLVGGGFGIFALGIPVLMLIFGWRLFRYKPLNFNYVAISFTLVIILGSLTAALFFGTMGDLFGSGLGGEYGLAMNDKIEGSFGFIGALLLVVAGWVLTGLFINRNFLDLVDGAGAKALAGATVAGKWLWAKMPKRKEASTSGAEAAAAATAVPLAAESTTAEAAEGIAPITPLATTEVPTPAAPVEAQQPSGVVAEDEYPFKDPNSPLEVAGSNTIAPLSPIDVASVLGVSEDAASSASTAGAGAAAAGVGALGAATSTKGEDDDNDDNDNLVVTVTENPIHQLDAEDIENDIYDPMRDLYSYEPPTPSLLTDHKSKAVIDETEIFENKERIRETLLNFGIPIRSMHATVGPTVTLYEIVQEQGVKISKIQGLEDDIAQNLKALGIRIIAPMPGRGTVGIEVPNQTKQTVSMYSSICSQEFQESKAELPVVIGRTIQNENYTFDLAKMPHLLVAGATGQGKSVGLNAIITSLLYRKHPAELKFVLIDPKMVEFSLYSRLEKHFLAKMESEDDAIVTDPKKAVYTLNSLCTEMANRLELCKQAHAKNIVEYNAKFLKRRLNPEHGHRFMPYIVVVIDEFADLIMTAKEVEAPVMRLAQKARAIGIHLIVATQRPDVRVITGGIKANFPARIAFRVMQMTDSRTIIDQPGANQLIGRGDMLLSNGGELTRIQCAFVDTPEVENVVEHIGSQQGYTSAYALPDYTPEGGSGDFSVTFGSEESSAPQKYDPKFGEIAREAVSTGMISTSMIQRNFEVGFNRAGRIMLQLERAGIVGPQVGSKPRDIKFYDLPSLEARLQELGVD